MQVLRLIGRGLGNGAIARELGLTVRTVEGLRTVLALKLGVGSRTALIIEAVRRGLVRPHRVARSSPPLTAREAEFLRLLMSSRSKAAVAALLGRPLESIEALHANIIRKVGARNIAELAYFAFQHGHVAASPHSRDLSPRQAAVLLLLGEGLANAEIARRLGVTKTTVKAYRTTLAARPGGSSRIALIKEAIRRGLVKPPSVPGPSRPLSPRQEEVLRCAMTGAPTLEAARHLGISRSALNAHLAQIRTRIGATSMAQLTYFAMQYGFATLDLLGARARGREPQR